MTAASVASAGPGRLGRLARVLSALVLGTLAASSAPTSIILLGWLQRRMRMAALHRAGTEADAPGWILGPRGSGVVTRSLGGLGANIREGVMAAVSLTLATLPFTAIWGLAWWAGWENSFSKGYEQAFVGPLLAFGGIAVFVAIMVFLPLGLAHQAVENRALALFELRRVRAVFRETGWQYVLFAAATVVLALPVFAGRGLVTFAEGIYPGLADLSPEEVSDLMASIALLKAGWVFVALVWLRGWSARLYADAATRAAARAPDAWRGTAMAELATGAPARWRGGRWLRTTALWAIWFGLAAQIFVAQFLNHSWWAWFIHPFLLLPMAI